MDAFTYCPAWPPELKAAERERQRNYYLIRSLAAKLERIEPEGAEYWDTLTRLEAAQDALYDASEVSLRLQHQYETKKNSRGGLATDPTTL